MLLIFCFSIIKILKILILIEVNNPLEYSVGETIMNFTSLSVTMYTSIVADI